MLPFLSLLLSCYAKGFLPSSKEAIFEPNLCVFNSLFLLSELVVHRSVRCGRTAINCVSQLVDFCKFGISPGLMASKFCFFRHFRFLLLKTFAIFRHLDFFGIDSSNRREISLTISSLSLALSEQNSSTWPSAAIFLNFLNLPSKIFLSSHSGNAYLNVTWPNEFRG